MKKTLFFIITVALVSCMSEENGTFNDQKGDSSIRDDEIWICHNPESPIHQSICPKGKEYLCLEPGNSSKFCWKLKVEDCLGSKDENREKVCENFY